MTGNLSFQIEHHLFPDLPSNRYQEISPRVAEIMERYGLTHVSGSLPRQVASAWGKVIRLALPNGFVGRTSRSLAKVTSLPARLAESVENAVASAA
jgi:linoleoyl-CoA desaturase